MNKDSILYVIVFTFVVTFLFVVPLTLAQVATAPQVAANQELARQRAVLQAMGLPFSTDEEVGKLYATVRTEDRGGSRLYSTTVNGKTIYAAEVSGPGLWGTIYSIVAVDEGLDQIEGLSVLSHNETPGLGGRIDETWYQSQYAGLRPRNGQIALVPPGESGVKASKEAGTVDGITGASRTSQFMVALVNKSLEKFKQTLGVR